MPVLIVGLAVLAGLYLAFSGAGDNGVSSVPSGGAKKGGGGLKQVDPKTYLLQIETAAARHVEFTSMALLAGLIQQESKFNADAVSPTGAVGLGQFTSIGRAEVRRLMTLAKWHKRFESEPKLAAKLAGFEKADALNATIAIEAVALYLASLLDKWHGNEAAATTEYNAGGKAAKIVAEAGSHAAAVPALQALPENQRSQSVTYAPAVIAWEHRWTGDGFAA